MLKVRKNYFSQWELLLKVLSEEVPENDPAFLHWLEADKENKELYLRLKGKGQKESLPFDKDKMFDNISDILSLNIQKKIPVYQRTWLKYAAFFLGIALIGLTGYFMLTNPDIPQSAKSAKIEKNIFDPGSKKAYLLSSQGKTIDLSETFELKNSDGTVVTNKSEGILSFRQSTPRKADKPLKNNTSLKNNGSEKKNEPGKKQEELQTIYVPKGGEYELLLADGTKVYLNSETRLVFPSHFEGETREVELTGEAYFEVKKDTKPFLVKTENMQIKVLGTSFNVNAYQNNTSVNATLVEGSIRVFVPDSSKTFLLTPENNFSMNKTSCEISIRKVNTDVYTAWVKGEFVFRNQTLDDIFTQLARWYDIKIEYANPVIRTMRFTGSAEKVRPLDYLLNQIQLVTDIKYKNEEDKIILY